MAKESKRIGQGHKGVIAMMEMGGNLEKESNERAGGVMDAKNKGQQIR